MYIYKLLLDSMFYLTHHFFGLFVNEFVKENTKHICPSLAHRNHKTCNISSVGASCAFFKKKNYSFGSILDLIAIIVVAVKSMLLIVVVVVVVVVII